jgi:hypothetical protein
MQAILDPLSAMLERLAAVAILTAQERAPHAARDAVVHAGRSGWNELDAWIRHGHSMKHVLPCVCQQVACSRVGKFGRMGVRGFCLVQHVRDWPYSSFHRHVAQGHVPLDWGDAAPESNGCFGE